MDQPISPTQAPDRSRLLALGWAAFVACSWTWCIGMYLPVLMIRDFGGAGWFVFMLPNVVGAAALGWVLHRQGSAAKLAREHWPAAALFSLVTILFHAFFVGWIIASLVGHAAETITVAAAAGFYFYGRRGRRDLIAAGGLFAFSALAFIAAALLPDVRPTGRIDVQPFAGLLYLTPVCIFGFLLCPYLDLTFLRARASTESHTGIAAFTLGFGVLFLIMLLFTNFYARFMQPDNVHSVVPAALRWLIAGHMMLQTAYTVALHTRAISEDRRARKLDVIASFFAALVLVFLVGIWSDRVLPAGFNSGEFVYRLFMAFYGLIFPAYVWIFMIPPPKGAVVSVRRKRALLAVAVLIAAPMFWMGFIESRMIWLLPGLGVVLLARVGLSARVSTAAAT
ncbi:MAG TPA: hypothetical protein VFE47_16930 [Tepidisphaeraceae bacterium]|jgi:hypothetical protein|nr:hypothetical protein [Tepidisphaeraceae bacterium]